MQEAQEIWVWSLGGEDPLEEEMATPSSILAGKHPGQRSLESYSPWGLKESDANEQLSMYRGLPRFKGFEMTRSI